MDPVDEVQQEQLGEAGLMVSAEAPEGAAPRAQQAEGNGHLCITNNVR
jgi:hypothetical protein